ncbi:MAG TPA: hypothetical protein VI451_18520 [Anaerolineales bacterium]|nr:hypothetical protein [Anaerolineales bacterium]
MSRSDKLALLLSFIAIAAAYLVASRVFENIPHLEDEVAYVWQAKLMAAGKVTIPTPIEPKKFLIPFVVDYNGQRFGKYPLGWPALLAVGIKLGMREWVNPLLAGLAVWLTYVLGKKLMGEVVGGLAALLTVTSPFFLVNVGTLLSHALGLVLSLGFVLAWWGMVEKDEGEGMKDEAGRADEENRRKGEKEKRRDGEGMGWLAAVTAGLVLGVFAISRPFTAIGVAIPIGFHGLYLLIRGSLEVRKRVLVVGIIALVVSLLHLLWQYAATGDPLLNLYTLWWEYDKVGFGPGIGVGENGHTLRQAWINTKQSLRVGYSDLFGWPMISWLFLPFGVWAARRNRRMLVAGSIYVSLLVLYMGYWIGAWLFGPRYQFDGLYSLTLLSAAGMAWLAGWRSVPENRNSPPAESGLSPTDNWRKARAVGITALIAVLFLGNLIFYLPARLHSMYGLYEMTEARMAPFLTPEAQALVPAVIIVHGNRWTDYGTLLDLEDPFLASPFIFTFGDKSTFPAVLLETFPDRGVYHYYMDEEPFRFYTDRVPEFGP